MPIKILGATVGVLAMGCLFLLQQLKGEVEEHGFTKQRLVQTTAVVSELNTRIKGMREDQRVAEEVSLAITNKFNAVRRDLEGMRNREDVVLKRKSWIALKINKAFNKSQAKLACITGDKQLCGKE
jgi:hypothetical protein|tara:strand:- start:4529 stop:4906 length:378 start_codon:yes stop_codon:yes gene_type:complete